jgi:hypothetical protein
MDDQICSKAMLVSLSIQGMGMILSDVEDRQAGDTLAHQQGVNPEVIRVMKKLLDPKRVPEAKALVSARNALYTYFRQETLLWGERGVRALPSSKYFDLTAGIGERKAALEGAFESVLAIWPQLKADAKTALNGMWREADWPDAETLRARFNVRVKVRPMVDASQFKALMGYDEEVATIREQIEKDVFTDLSAGLLDLFRQLRVYLADEESGFINRVGSYSVDAQGKVLNTFRDSAVGKLRELCSRVRGLNVVGDPTLNEIVEEIEAGVCKHTAEALRDDCVLRKSVVQNAQSAAAKLAAVEGILGRRLEAA